MNRPRLLPIACLALLAAARPLPSAAAEAWPLSVSESFAGSLDLDSIRRIAVQDDGRVKTFDSLAREKVKLVNASRAAVKSDAVLLYLDLMLAPEHYETAEVVFVKKRETRHVLTGRLRSTTDPSQRTGLLAEDRLKEFERTGLTSMAFLDQPAVRAVLSDMERDLLRTSKEVQKINAARTVADSRWLRQAWRVIPAPGEDPIAPWFPADAAWQSEVPEDETHAGMGGPSGGGVPGLEEAKREAIAVALTALELGWGSQKAETVNQAFRELAAVLPTVAPAVYPAAGRLGWELWYYGQHKLTWTWILYFLALPFLLMALVYGFRWARAAGLALFGFAFALHTFSIALRWYLAGRIPNANMFEAITASAWFGCVVALILEVTLRRRAIRNMPALSASTYAMGAMMCGHFMPVQLNSDLFTLMPVLDRTIWLYIHTNMVIASYALIFFAAVTATLYLVGRGVAALSASPRVALAWAGASGVPGAGAGAASLILGGGGAGAGRGGSLEESGLSRSLDGATMIFLELAFLTLGIGTVLGAVWAGVSWGRPWGWDPKEVFALNTWLVLLVLVHVRLKVRDKALWTAILALVATGVMLFNWIAVNFVITGLHSYA